MHSLLPVPGFLPGTVLLESLRLIFLSGRAESSALLVLQMKVKSPGTMSWLSRAPQWDTV